MCVNAFFTPLFFASAHTGGITLTSFFSWVTEGPSDGRGEGWIYPAETGRARSRAVPLLVAPRAEPMKRGERLDSPKGLSLGQTLVSVPIRWSRAKPRMDSRASH